MSTLLLYWAYGLCIALGMWGDQSWRSKQTWSLGRWSKPLAWLSVTWIILLTPVFLFPFELNVASLATVGGFLVFLAVYYVVWARERFHGPVPQGTEEQLTAIEREFEEAAAALTA